MKKRLLSIFIIMIMMCAPLMLAGVFVENVSNVASAEEGVDGISSMAEITDYSKSYVLNEDITIEWDSYSPIGTYENPFTGVFDGNGNTITIKNAPVDPSEPVVVAEEPAEFKYQGIFGYANGATFKNVQIIYEADFSIDLSFSADIDEYYYGSLLGKGEGVTIEECEVENESSDGVVNPIIVKSESRLTFGGIAGALASNSTIKNCGSIFSYNLELDLTNSYTVKAGGLLGELYESTMVCCTSTCSAYVSNESTSTQVELKQGGIVGNVCGATAQMYNSATRIAYVTDLTNEDVKHISGLIGAITKPKPIAGNIISCGYYYEINSVSGTNFYGNSDVVAYEYKDSTDKDYIVAVPYGIMSVEKFFTEDNYNECGMYWYELKPCWDFSSDWIVTNDVARLQQFQKFEIMLVSDLADPKPLDDTFDCLEDISKSKYIKTTDTDINASKKYFTYDATTGAYVHVTSPNRDALASYYEISNIYVYGTPVEFELQFKRDENGIDQYQGYYEIIDIYRDGDNLNLSQFDEETQTLEEEGTTTVTVTKTSSDGNFKLETIKTTYTDTKESEIKFKLTVTAGYTTKGSYSFVITEVPYYAYIIAEEGGNVSASTSQNAPSYKEIELESLTKNKSRDVKAISAYQHVFEKWTIWYEISKDEYNEATADKANESKYFVYKQVDSETQQEIPSYWKLKEDLTEIVLNGLNSSEYKITFGEEPFTQNFMLKANFVKKTYSLSLSNFDLNTLYKVEIVYNTNQVYTFNENSTNKDYLELDQNETITMKVYLKSGYSIDENAFPNKMKVDLIDKSTYNQNGQSGNVCTFSIATSSLKDLVNGQQQYGLELIASESTDGENSGMPLWLIIVIIAGGALVLVGIIILIVKLARRNKAPKGSKNQNFDQLYR